MGTANQRRMSKLIKEAFRVPKPPKIRWTVSHEESGKTGTVKARESTGALRAFSEETGLRGRFRVTGEDDLPSVANRIMILNEDDSVEYGMDPPPPVKTYLP